MVVLSTSGRSYTQPFQQAFCKTTEGNDRVIVLTGRGEHLRRVLRIRTLWQPVTGAKPDSPAATNAALHYFVIADAPASGPPSYIHYAGTGFVTVDDHGDPLDVHVAGATLSRLDRRGAMSDPLERFTLRGDFSAAKNSERVDVTLQRLGRDVPPVRHPPASREMPPP